MSNHSSADPSSFVDIGTATHEQVALSLEHTVTGLKKGESYAFRYRARNEYGWSTTWSPITYIVAADAPSTPAAPTLINATDSSVAVALTLPTENGGRILSAFELYRDDGSESSNPTYQLVSSYSSTSFKLEHQMTVGIDSLVKGKIYRFVTKATNAKGASAFSNVL